MTGAGVLAVCRVELRKLVAQLPARVLAAVCLLAPFAFVAVLAIQTAVPQDTLFGRWVHVTGFAVPLVVLSFAGAWAFPVIGGVVAGDIFAGEDRHDTWKTVLTRSVRRADVFTGKVLAAALAAAALVCLLAASSIVAGALESGIHPLVGLSGQTIGSSRAAELVTASWALELLPALAFAGLAVLVSVATRSAAAGMLVPLLAGLGMQVLSLVGSGEILRTVLLSSALDGWHGLFVSPSFHDRIVQTIVSSCCYIAVCLGASWLIVRRRDFAGAPAPRTRTARIRILVVAAAAIALLGAASGLGPTAITASRLSPAIASTFDNLTVLQQTLLGRHVPAGAALRILQPLCRRRGVSTTRRGPGDNWVCALNVIRPAAAAALPINYEVTVRANGCYTAEGPPSFIGPLTIHDPEGRPHVNPLFQFDGCFDAP